ncbi:MAG: extracellular solute-binding protein [Anaerolineae bacterium]|nr:extracellular solute-binding protein [Anaerolineae bacterium]
MNKHFRFSVYMLLVAALILPTALVGAQGDEVTIRWWHIATAEADAAVFQDIADAYMEMNPNVNIEITILENEAFKSQLTTVIQAGDPPDLFQSWGGGVLWAYAENGMLRDISADLEGEWYDSFAAPAAVELFGMDGEYYGVPWRWGAVGMFYNKALFEQAGLDPEAPPATWTEFLDAVQALKDAGITPIALGGKDKWPGHFWWVYLAIRTGGEEAFLQAYNREGSFADEPFVRAGELLKDLIDMDPFPAGFLGMTFGDEGAQMGNSLAAMELMGQWAPGNQETNSEDGAGVTDVLGWFPFPALEDGAGSATDTLGGGDGFVVGVNAPDETIDFLRYLTTVENQMSAPFLFSPPTVVGADVDLINDPIVGQIIKARNEAEYFQLYYDQFLPPALAGTVLDAVEQLFAGTMTPEEVALMIEDSAALELE